MIASGAMTAQAQPVVLPPNPAMLDLGRALPFAVLAGLSIVAGITNDISGPGSHLFGIAVGTLADFPGHANIAGLSGAEKILGVPAAVNAQADAQIAWDAGKAAVMAGLLNGRTRLTSGNTTVTSGELGSAIPYKRGIYTRGTGGVKDDEAYNLSSDMTLDAQNDPSSVFIFHSDAALTTGANIKIILTNGARADHVFWLIGDAFTAGATSTFSGTLISKGAPTIGANTKVFGQILGLAGTVVTTGAGTEFITTAIPEPGTYGAAMGAVVLGVVMLRRRKPRGSR